MSSSPFWSCASAHQATHHGIGVCLNGVRYLLLFKLTCCVYTSLVLVFGDCSCYVGSRRAAPEAVNERDFCESALIWLVTGFILLTPVFYPGKTLFTFPVRSLIHILTSAALNAVGAWAPLAAMKSGGRASIVVPFIALYPLVVVLTAPIILRESISLTQGIGVGCALVAVVLLST